MTWADSLTDDIAAEFSGLADDVTHAVAIGTLSLRNAGRCWWTKYLPSDPERRRAQNREWFRRWYERVKRERDERALEALRERNRKAQAEYVKRHREHRTRQPANGRPLREPTMAWCARCAGIFVQNRDTQVYCGGRCRESAKTRRRNNRLLAARESQGVVPKPWKRTIASSGFLLDEAGDR